MADWPSYPPDVAICRLLAGEPLPTATIADRLASPVRTVRHRLRQLRRDGVVVVGADGLHHLAALAGPDQETVAVLAAPDLAVLAGSVSPTEGSGRDDMPSAIAALAVALIGLAALVLAGRRPAAPPAPPIRSDPPVDPWWPEW
jgi:hypothetical protein